MKRHSKATLVDLLDRVLDRGLVLDADLIVSVAGIPLLGVNLRAALAGIDTMKKYGMFVHWDETIRKRARDGNDHTDSPLVAARGVEHD